MPKDLLDKVLAARTFNAGFTTVEFTSSALVDMAFHTRSEVADPMTVQAELLAELDMPASIVMRHATPHFQHYLAQINQLAERTAFVLDGVAVA